MSLLLLLGGCVLLPSESLDEWESYNECMQPLPFFQDADGDGWGDPTVEPQSQCREVEPFTARNDLDCDDSNADVTARLGSACPAQMVTGGVEFMGLTEGESPEYVVVYGTTEVMPAVLAQTSCQAWGGELATFGARAELFRVVDVVELELGAPYAGWVGLVDLEQTGSWTWVDGGTLEPSALGWCEDPPPASTAATDRMALVNADGGACFGMPDGTVTTHFICQRTWPNPEDFNWIQLVELKGAESDTGL